MGQKVAVPDVREIIPNDTEFYKVLNMTEKLPRVMFENSIERRVRDFELQTAQLKIMEAVMRPVTHLVNNFLQRLMIIRYEIEASGTLSESTMGKIEADILKIARQMVELNNIKNPAEPGVFDKFMP